MKKHSDRGTRNLRPGERARLRQQRLFLAYQYGKAAQPQSERSQAKAAARERALDQVALDKLNNREHGATCRALYRAECKKAAEKWANRREGRAALHKRKTAMREAASYRGYGNTRKARALWLRARRAEAGLTRPQLDDVMRRASEERPKLHWVQPGIAGTSGEPYNKTEENERRRLQMDRR